MNEAGKPNKKETPVYRKITHDDTGGTQWGG